MTQSNGIKEMLSKSGYSDEAIQYYIERLHMGNIRNADQVSEMTGTCGDTMGIYLKVDDGKIVDAKYEVLGCAGAISAAMAVVDLIKGKEYQRSEKAGRRRYIPHVERDSAKKTSLHSTGRENPPQRPR